ncbi:penicillin acylase family protein [Acidobacteriota bacterium]
MFRSGDQNYSLQWEGVHNSDDLEGFLGLSEAGGAEDIEKAAAFLGCPGLNIVYADITGRIGKVFAGRFPHRRGFDGSLVVNGTTTRYDGEDIITEEHWPKVTDPPGGIIVSANEAPHQDKELPLLSLFPSPDHRARRILEVLEEKEKHTQDTALKPQTDIRSLYASEIMPVILDAAVQTGLDRWAEAAAAVLKEWDFAFSLHSVGASVFHSFYQALLRILFEEKMGSILFRKFSEGYSGYIAVQKLFENSSSPLWEGSMPEKIALALSEGTQVLVKRCGTVPRAWQWGRLFELELTSPYALIPGIRDRKGRIKLGQGRGTYTTPLQFMHRRKGKKEIARLGPAARLFVELSDPPVVKAVLSSGQSEIPSNPHFADMTEKYMSGDLIQLNAFK